MNILITILLAVAGIIAIFLIIALFLKRNNMSIVKLSSMHTDKKYLTF